MNYYYSHIIDAELASNLRNETEASLYLRVVNFLIDYISIYCLSTLVGILVGYISATEYLFFNASQFTPFLDYVIFTSTLLVYFSTEYLFNGKSLGKFLTCTRVKCKTEHEISFKTYLLRSLWRLIPFEGLSFISGIDDGWHDQFSDTYVVFD